MKKFILLLLLTVFPIGVQSQKKATLIIRNAKIITLDDSKPGAQAVAISGEKIIAVGTNAEISKFQNSQTKIIDAKGKTAIPGLYDSHLHVIRGGRFYNTELRWDGVKTLKRALEMLKEQSLRTPKGQWVRVVGGWTEFQFAEKRGPTLDEINAATGSTPAFILKLYGEAYLNQAGLQQLGIDENTPNPNGGWVQKDRSGQPTGLLVAEPNAFILYSTLARLPELSQEEKINSTRLFLSELNSLGVTSVMDAGGGFQNYPDDYAITDLLSKANQLTVRLPYYLFAQKPGKELEDYQKWTRIVGIETDHDPAVEYHVQGGGENLVASGADYENFTKPRPDLPAKMETELKAVLKILVQNKWPFRLHATYDESIGRFLSVIETVDKEIPLDGLPWFFDHAETVSQENLKRIKALGGGIAIQHRMAYQAEAFISRYGKKAALDSPPIGKMLGLGLKVGVGTDGTRVASYNPWVGLYWLVSGKSIGGTEFAAQENRLDRIAALKLFTIGSASLINQDKDRGKIKPGYLADLAILSGDYLSVEVEKIKEIKSEFTILGGKAVYGSGIFPGLAPSVPKAIPEWSPVNFYGGYQSE